MDCAKFDWYCGNCSHKVYCRIKEGYAQIRALKWPEHEEQIKAVFASVRAGLDPEQLGPSPEVTFDMGRPMEAFLRVVPSERRAAGVEGTHGIAGIESKELFQSMNMLGAIDRAAYTAHIEAVKHNYNDTPLHLVPFHDRPMAQYKSTDGTIKHGIQHFPSDYSMMSYRLYRFFWGEPLAVTSGSFRDPCLDAKDRQAALGMNKDLEGKAAEELMEIIEHENVNVETRAYIAGDRLWVLCAGLITFR